MNMNIIKEEVEQEIRKIIMKITGLAEEKIEDDANFIDDLGIESMDAFDIVVSIEKKFDIDIPEERFGEFDCVESAGEVVMSLLK